MLSDRQLTNAIKVKKSIGKVRQSMMDGGENVITDRSKGRSQTTLTDFWTFLTLPPLGDSFT